MAKAAKRGRPPLAAVEVICHGYIEAWDFLLSVNSGSKDQLRFDTLTGRGPLLTPVLGATAFEIWVDKIDGLNFEDGVPVGAISSVKPVVRAYVWLTQLERDLIIQFAAADRRIYVRFVAEKPRYGHARMKSCSFSLSPIE